METALKADSAPPSFLSPQLAAAMSHPTRVRAMSILGERVASPSQLAEEMDEPLNNVTYHVNQLLQLDCIELVRTEPRAGGRVLERFYRSTRRAYFDEEAWAELSKNERLGVVGAIVRMMSRDLAIAMASGDFFIEDRKHISRWPMRVDEEGWDEIRDLLEHTAEGLLEIETRVAGRQAEGEKAPLHVKVEMMQFRSPGHERGAVEEDAAAAEGSARVSRESPCRRCP